MIFWFTLSILKCIIDSQIPMFCMQDKGVAYSIILRKGLWWSLSFDCPTTWWMPELFL